MANPEHVANLKKGGKVWNAWREVRFAAGDFGADLSDAKLKKVKLSHAHLDGVELMDADLSGAILTEAHLGRANLLRANLIDANLAGAEFYDANLSKANLSCANLTGATLQSTNLSGAILDSADLSAAKLRGTVFGNTDLSRVKGLESCIHNGPSVIDHQTLARSGRLPLEFLRGCGLSDTFIEYMPSIFGAGIEFQSCFISYSTKDQEFADRLYADLQNKGVRCWFAPHDIQGGKKLHEQIDRAIQMHDRLLLLLSEHSMGSEWVKTEIATAREREAREGRQVLFPLALVGYEAVKGWKCFDADRGKDTAREIREYYVPDFSGWKDHDSYQPEFERLVRDLKAK